MKNTVAPSTLKPTSAQLWMANSLEALAVGAVVTAAINIYTAFSAGNLTLSQALVIAATAVGAVLSKGLASLLTNPQTVQAGQDTINELRDATIALINSHQNLLATFTTFLQQQAASSSAQPIAIAQPLNQGTLPVQTPFTQPVGQPVYMPNLNATATAAPPTPVQTFDATGIPQWNPPDPNIHFSQVLPVVSKP